MCERYDYHARRKRLTTATQDAPRETFYGKEKKRLAYVIAIMNMILHGIEAPNIIHTNTLSENLDDIQEKDRYDMILANPPFGGKERPEVQQNFPIRRARRRSCSSSISSRSLKAGGRGAIVIKNTFLSNTDNACVSLRKRAFDELQSAHGSRMPGRHISRRGREDRGAVLRERRADQKDLVLQARSRPQPRQDQPAQRRRLEEFVRLQARFEGSDNSWSLDAKTIDAASWDISVKNPNKAEETALRDPLEIMDEIAALDLESAEILAGIRGLL